MAWRESNGLMFERDSVPVISEPGILLVLDS
jgi:hypothetical protein